jgi:hypothetical protein
MADQVVGGAMNLNSSKEVMTEFRDAIDMLLGAVSGMDEKAFDAKQKRMEALNAAVSEAQAKLMEADRHLQEKLSENLIRFKQDKESKDQEIASAEIRLKGLEDSYRAKQIEFNERLQNERAASLDSKRKAEAVLDERIKSKTAQLEALTKAAEEHKRAAAAI